MIKRLLFLLLFSASPLLAQDTIQSTVCFQDAQGNCLANGQLTLDLSQPAKVTGGGGLVAPLRISVTLDSTGKIPAGTKAYGNDQLTPSGTVYRMRVYNSNGLLASDVGLISIQGVSPVDLSQLTPVASQTVSYPNPAILSSNNAFTGNNTHSGTETFTGALNATGPASSQIFAGVLDGAAIIGSSSSLLWKYPCSTAGVQSAIADALALANGVTQQFVDARPCQTMAITSEIDIGNATPTPLTFLLPTGTWTVTGMTSGTGCAIKQFSNTALIGPGQHFQFVLHGGLATNSLQALYCTTNAAASYFRAESFQVTNPNSASVTNGTFDIEGGADDSVWYNINVAGYGTTGINIANLCCGAKLDTVTSNSVNTAGGIPMKVGATVSQVLFSNMSVDHPGAGLPNIQFANGSSVTDWANLYMEGNNTDNTTAFIQNLDTGSGSDHRFFGVEAQAKSGASTACVFSNTGTGTIIVKGLKKNAFNAAIGCAVHEIGLGISPDIQTDSTASLDSYDNHRVVSTGQVHLVGNELRLQDSSQAVDGRIGGGSFAAGVLGIGTISNSDVRIYTNNAARWRVDSGGNLGPLVDASYPIGSAGLRPTNIFFSGTLQNGTLTWTPPAFTATLTGTVASGTATLTANATLTTNTCQTAITVAAAGAATTDSIEWSYATAPATGDALETISPYLTSGNVNFTRCNTTSASQNVTAIVINWRVLR